MGMSNVMIIRQVLKKQVLLGLDLSADRPCSWAEKKAMRNGKTEGQKPQKHGENPWPMRKACFFPISRRLKAGKNGRKQWENQGKSIYEWDWLNQLNIGGIDQSVAGHQKSESRQR